jgi:hypothetical protein
VRWSEVADRQPRLADLGERLLGVPGVVLVGTIRRDGTPRLSPIEPFFWEGDLWLSMLWGSRKALDLVRDPRILVHNIVTQTDAPDGEFKVRGRAVAEEDEGMQAAYRDAVSVALGWKPVVGRFHLYRVDVEDISYLKYDAATGDQYVSRWPDGNEYVRRGTSATSVGPPEQRGEDRLLET